MTGKGLTEIIEKALREALPDAGIGTVDGESAIGVDIDGSTWFVSVDAA